MSSIHKCVQSRRATLTRQTSAWGLSRRTEEPQRFAECPLCFHQQLNLCVATKCREVPCVDGSELARRIFTSLCWSVQPCVRPFGAVHTTAGHNALRGSGPGQKDAFDNAMAQVGCPDRRIDRLCITCCSLLPTFTSRRMSGATLVTPQARRVPCSVHIWPSWPRPFGLSCWQAQWLRPSPADVPTRP